jgi:hypothetical protein
MRAMELDSIECVSYTDGMEEDDDAAPAQLPRPFLKSPATAGAVVASDSGGGAGAGPLVPPATGVHELLECPVCTNSMYPPIHQVRFISCFPFRGTRCVIRCRQYGILVVARAWALGSRDGLAGDIILPNLYVKRKSTAP